jgi:hypothetical protein
MAAKGTGGFPVRAAALAALLCLCAGAAAGCGERFEWDPDGSGDDPGAAPGDGSGDGKDPKRVLGPTTGSLVFGAPVVIGSGEGTEQPPRVGLAPIKAPWVLGGSGKGSYLKLHLECLEGIDAEEKGCVSGDGSQAFETLRVAVADDEGGLLKTGQAAEGAKALMSEAEDEKSLRAHSSFTILSKGEEKVARGGILVVLPLGGEPVPGWSRVLLVERVEPVSRETTFWWIPFRYELDR